MKAPGSQRSLQKLVDAHYESLYRYAYRLSGSRVEAEDLTQDTFCQAQMKYYQLRDPDKARAWLFSILRNNYLHRCRDAKHEQTVSLDWIDDLAEPANGSLPEVDPEKLQNALNSLPEVYRTPIILYYFEEFSYRDIAEQMDLPMGTVMSRLARARAHLRTHLFPDALAQTDRRANDGL
jgi:RNA polymerase sigma-70 factor (ECF subfamily)